MLCPQCNNPVVDTPGKPINDTAQCLFCGASLPGSFRARSVPLPAAADQGKRPSGPRFPFRRSQEERLDIPGLSALTKKGALVVYAPEHMAGGTVELLRTDSGYTGPELRVPLAHRLVNGVRVLAAHIPNLDAGIYEVAVDQDRPTTRFHIRVTADQVTELDWR